MLKFTVLLVSTFFLVVTQNNLNGNAFSRIKYKPDISVPEGGIKIGAGWDFLHVFSGGKGILYAITDNYDLLYYKHQDKPTGERQFPIAGLKIGTGWEFKHVFSGGDGVIYAINQKNELIYYKHVENPTTSRNFIEPGIRIGTGWDFKKVFAGGGGIIYAINHNYDLIYYKHIANPTKDINFENSGYKIGAGWNFRDVFSGGNNIIFAVDDKNELLYYQHKNNPDKEKQFVLAGELFESNWKFINSMSGGSAIIYGLTESRDLFYYGDMEIDLSDSDLTNNSVSTNKSTTESNSISTSGSLSVMIGKQTWMVENLNVDRFANGDIILEAKTNEEWQNAVLNGIPAWCHYENNTKNGNLYGKLYNWYAVNDRRGLAPAGWRIPNDADWNVLVDYVGGMQVGGKNLKSKVGWFDNSNGIDRSGFAAFPSGMRFANGIFYGVELEADYWSRSEFSAKTATEVKFSSLDEVISYDEDKGCGLTVRCIK